MEIYDTIRRPIADEASDASFRMSRTTIYLPGYLPADTDAEKLKANDKEEFKKMAAEIENIWSFHFSKMPQEDWIRAKELFDMLELGGESD